MCKLLISASAFSTAKNVELLGFYPLRNLEIITYLVFVYTHTAYMYFDQHTSSHPHNLYKFIPTETHTVT